MRVTCSVSRANASPGLPNKIDALGVPPIITNFVIRAVYDGPDRKLGEAIVDLFAQEKDHDIYVSYSRSEMLADEKRALRQKGK